MNIVQQLKQAYENFQEKKRLATWTEPVPEERSPFILSWDPQGNSLSVKQICDDRVVEHGYISKEDVASLLQWLQDSTK